GRPYITGVHFAPGQGQQPGHAYLHVYTPIVLDMSLLSDQVAFAAHAGLLPISASQAAALVQGLKAVPSPRVGYLRSTINLDYIWGIVGHEQSTNGDGSYAFITDENGIRIASSQKEELFTTIQALDPNTLKAIQTEKRFGSDAAPSFVDLPDVAASLSNSDA